MGTIKPVGKVRVEEQAELQAGTPVLERAEVDLGRALQGVRRTVAPLGGPSDAAAAAAKARGLVTTNEVAAPTAPKTGVGGTTQGLSNFTVRADENAAAEVAKITKTEKKTGAKKAGSSLGALEGKVIMGSASGSGGGGGTATTTTEPKSPASGANWVEGIEESVQSTAPADRETKTATPEQGRGVKPEEFALPKKQPPLKSRSVMDQISAEEITDDVTGNKIDSGIPIHSLEFVNQQTPSYRPSQKKAGLDSSAARNPGSSINQIITGDDKVPIHQVSIFIDDMYRLWKDSPESMIRVMLEQNLDVYNQDEMLRDPEYAKEVLMNFFNDNTVFGVVEKTVNAEETTLLLIIKVHAVEAGTKVHPALAPMMNADFDGDMLRFTVDPDTIANTTKTSFDHLIGTDGEVKLDPDFTGFSPMEGGSAKIIEMLRFALRNIGAIPYDNLAAIEAAMLESWSVEGDGGLVMLVNAMRDTSRALAEPFIGEDDYAVRRMNIEADLFKAIFEANHEIRKYKFLKNEELRTAAFEASNYADPKGKSFDGIQPVMPEEAANDPTAIHLIGGKAGKWPGKNNPFRQIANIAKMYRIYPGINNQDSGDTKFETFIRRLALAISRASDYGSQNDSIATMYRRNVVKNAEFPKKYAMNHSSMKRWIEEQFIPAFNFEAWRVNSADIKINLDKSTSRSEDNVHVQEIPAVGDVIDGKTMTQSDVDHYTVRAFKSVYGRVLMGTLFGDACPPKYANMTLEEFVHNNTLNRAERGTSAEGFRTPVKKVNGETTGGEFRTYLFIGRLADLRTQAKKKVNDQFVEATEATMVKTKITVDGKEHTVETPAIMTIFSKYKKNLEARETDPDSTAPVEALVPDLIDAIEILRYFGQAMFDHFGLSNIQAFLSTDLGKALMDSSSANQTGGIVYTMLGRYRFSALSALTEAYGRAIEAKDQQAASDAINNYQAALDEIAESSIAWKVIAFNFKKGAVYGENADQTYVDWLFNSGFTKSEIDSIVAKEVRTSPVGHVEYELTEVAADLFSDPSNTGGTRHLSRFGYKQIIDDLKTVTRQSDSFVRTNYLYAQESVTNARKKKYYRGSGDSKVLIKDPLKTYLETLRYSPMRHTFFTPAMIGDAIISIAWQTYEVSEKGSKMAALNYLIRAVGSMVNGDSFAHADVVGTLSLNKRSLESVSQSPDVWLRLLTDPDYQVRVFDKYGRRVTLSREVIFGTPDPSEAQLWEFLEENPRVAMMLRQMGFNYIEKGDGIVSQKAVKSLKNTMEDVLTREVNLNEDAMRVLANHPGYYALIASTSGWLGARTFQLRESVLENVLWVPGFLRSLYVEGPPVQSDVENLVRDIWVKNYGEEKVAKFEAAGKAFEEQPADVEDADNIIYKPSYHMFQIMESQKEYIWKYASLLHESGIDPVSPSEVAEKYTLDILAEKFKVNDPATLLMWFKSEESIGGAKTEFDTGVNGSRSRKYWWSIYLAKIMPQPCDAPMPPPVSLLEFRSDWQSWSGMNARTGENSYEPVHTRSIGRILAYAEKEAGGQVFVENPAVCTNPTCACIRHATTDPSSNEGPNQTPAFVRALIIIRTLSAEKLNLKTVTLGDDGKDSITKLDLYGDPYYAKESVGIIDAIQTIFGNVYQSTLEETGNEQEAIGEAMAHARTNLAYHLRKAFSGNPDIKDEKGMGYGNTLQDSDLLNIAQLMVKRISDDVVGEGEGATYSPRIEILSWEEINDIVELAVNRKLAEKPEASWEELQDAALVAITDQNINEETLDLKTVFGMTHIFTEGSVYPSMSSGRESSQDRNLQLINEIARSIEVAGISQEYVTEERADHKEAELLKILGERADSWKKWIGVRKKNAINSTDRNTYRLTGLLMENGTLNHIKAIGGRNAFLLHGSNPNIEEAIRLGYDLGVNVFIKGKVEPEVWESLYESIGIDQLQAMNIDERTESGAIAGDRTIMIPMFDLRLNGMNRSIQNGAINVGVFRRSVEHLRQMTESLLNPYNLGDGEWFKTTLADTIEHRKNGTYSISINKSFKHLIEHVNEARANGGKYDGIEQAPTPEKGVRIAVYGSPSMTDYYTVKSIIQNSEAYRKGRIEKIVVREMKKVGVPPGADRLAVRWAQENGVEVEYVEDSGDPKLARQDAWNLANSADIIIGFGGISEDKGTAALRSKANARAHKSKDAEYQPPREGREFKSIFVDTSSGTYSINGNTGTKVKYAKPVVEVGGLEYGAEVTVATAKNIKNEIADLMARGDFAGINFDLGISNLSPSSTEMVRFREAMMRFMVRYENGELNDRGFLEEALPDEIIGFMRAEVDGNVWFHPIRVFEKGNESGAPSKLTIESVGLSENGHGELDVAWSHAGTLENIFAKYFQYNVASVKLMGRPKSIGQITLEDGSEIVGGTFMASTSGRRLLSKMDHKAISLLFKSRYGKFGYNLAQKPGTLSKDPELKEAILTGKSQLSMWQDRIESGKPIQFVQNDTELNAFMNRMAQNCVRAGVDPTILFASHHKVGKKMLPSLMWFEFQILIDGSDDFHHQFMRFMHMMDPRLCPNGIYDTESGDTFFDRNLQVKEPYYDPQTGEYKGYHMVDLYIGFDFLDEHYGGYSGSGMHGSSSGPPSVPASTGGGGNLVKRALNDVNQWAAAISGPTQKLLGSLYAANASNGSEN